jgi:hypothetical protein
MKKLEFFIAGADGCGSKLYPPVVHILNLEHAPRIIVVLRCKQQN